MAPSVRAQHLQPVAEVLIHGHLQGVVVGPALIAFPADAPEDVARELLMVREIDILVSWIVKASRIGQTRSYAGRSDRVAIVRGDEIVGFGTDIANAQDRLSSELALDRQVEVHRERDSGARIQCVDRQRFHFRKIKGSSRCWRNEWELVRYWA